MKKGVPIARGGKWLKPNSSDESLMEEDGTWPSWYHIPVFSNHILIPMNNRSHILNLGSH